MTADEVEVLMSDFPTPAKLLARSLIRKQRYLVDEVARQLAGEAEHEAFPRAGLARLFATLYHSATSTGKTKDGKLTVVWPAFRKYCHWGLMEPPARLEKTLQLLAGLGLAELEMVPNESDPDEPEELGFVHFRDVELLRSIYRVCHERRADSLEELATALEPSSATIAAVLREIQASNLKGAVA